MKVISKWSELEREEKELVVDKLLEEIRNKLLNRATEISISNDRAHDEITAGFSRISIPYRLTEEVISIEIKY